MDNAAAPQEDAPLPLAPLIARLREAANGPVRAAISYLLDETAAALASQEAALDRAFQTLEINGVPRERAKSVSNGIDVLATRMRRQEDSLTAALARGAEQEAALRERDAEIAKVRGIANEALAALAEARDTMALGAPGSLRLCELPEAAGSTCQVSETK